MSLLHFLSRQENPDTPRNLSAHPVWGKVHKGRGRYLLREHMKQEPILLSGQSIRLEPLSFHHVDGLSLAAGADPTLYQWSPVPQGNVEASHYIRTALNWQDQGTALSFAIVRQADKVVLGSTRFWNMEYWDWLSHTPRYQRRTPDACEIGYSWLTRSAIRTGANTEAKLLMLTHAFETWQVLRVCFHTDARNERSKNAIERIGGKYEGILRSHRLATDQTARNSLRYSIIASEWPNVKERLMRYPKTL
jgi:N-acetyltransferase